MFKTAAFAALGMMAALGGAQASTEVAPAPVDLAIYPDPAPGQIRHVITLEPREHEANYKVEIYAGKTMMVDCNTIMISADLDDETVQGWGYNYFVIDDVGPAASTMMGCPDDSKKEATVGLLLGSDAFQRYNSKLPLVIYAPEDLTIGYRLWQTDGEVLQ